MCSTIRALPWLASVPEGRSTASPLLPAGQNGSRSGGAFQPGPMQPTAPRAESSLPSPAGIGCAGGSSDACSHINEATQVATVVQPFVPRRLVVVVWRVRGRRGRRERRGRGRGGGKGWREGVGRRGGGREEGRGGRGGEERREGARMVVVVVRTWVVNGGSLSMSQDAPNSGGRTPRSQTPGVPATLALNVQMDGGRKMQQNCCVPQGVSPNGAMN